MLLKTDWPGVLTAMHFVKYFYSWFTTHEKICNIMGTEPVYITLYILAMDYKNPKNYRRNLLCEKKLFS